MGAAALREGKVQKPFVCSVKMTKPGELFPHQYPWQDAVMPIWWPVLHSLPLVSLLPAYWFLTSEACWKSAGKRPSLWLQLASSALQSFCFRGAEGRRVGDMAEI